MKIKSFNPGKHLFMLAFLLITFSCKKENADPCANTVCLNGGHCVNGDCVCPEGYGGADCSQQITPRKIKITKIEVTKFPATNDNGGGWDLTNGPDIYLQLLKGDAQVWKSSDTYDYQNASPSTIHTIEISPSVDLTEPNDEYTIILYDYDDFDADDFMGGIIFTPYTNSNGFPSVVTLDANGGVAFKLYLSYVW